MKNTIPHSNTLLVTGMERFPLHFSEVRQRQYREMEFSEPRSNKRVAVFRTSLLEF